MSAASQFRPELLVPLLCDLAAREIVGEIPVRGTSMCPALIHGDRVQVLPARADEVGVGELVVRMGVSGPVIHRLVGWWWTARGWRMLTKGDGAPCFDPPLDPGCVLGRVIARVRNDQIVRLDGMGMRFRGRGRAAASFATGLIREAWSRAGRTVRLWLGRPGD